MRILSSTTIFIALSSILTSRGSYAFQCSRQVLGGRFAFEQRGSTTLRSTEQSSASAPNVVLERVFEQDSRPIILFDGVCNLCNSAVNLALDWDPSGKLRFAALQSKVGQNLLQAHGRDANDISSIVFVTPKGAYTKSDAILGITQELNPLPFVPLKPLALAGQYMVPQILRDAVYDGVANNRYSIMGKRDECRFDADGEFDDRFVDENLADG
jgi:predicted DCC family thiol-disulfide oxidoreductase YuxK